jgi:2-dehydropantoate 2-reductase
MKIAVVGCGAVGSFYGAKLCRAGHDVHFLLRSDYAAVRAGGVRIESPEGDFHVTPAPARQPEEIGVADLVLIALKTTANAEIPSLLPPLVGGRTRVVTLQNGLGSDELLARLIPPHQVFGGLCFVCLNRVAPAVIRHLAHGRVVLGAFASGREAEAAELVGLFNQARIPCEPTPSLAQARWEKLIWNVPFNGLGVAGIVGFDHFLAGRAPAENPRRPCLPTDELLRDERWLAVVQALMGEVIGAANALGYPVPPARAEENLHRTRSMGSYRASTLLDFEAGRPLELDSIFLEPQRRARATGFPTPWLDRLCAVLTRLAEKPARASGPRRE